MDPDLLELIHAFQSATAEALAEFLKRSGLAHPFEWRRAGLPRQGVLAGAPRIRYAFHGAGLDLRIGNRHIDFDFGYDGRTGGFNRGWLQQFAREHPERFARFGDSAHLEAALEAARRAGAIGRPFIAQQDGLEYLLTDGESRVRP